VEEIRMANKKFRIQLKKKLPKRLLKRTPKQPRKLQLKELNI
jgi:hypothetical protein